MIARVAHVLRRTLRIAGDRPRAAAWTLLAMTCALYAAGVAAVTATHVDRWADRPGGGASMVIYLGDEVDEAHATALVTELRGLAGVEAAQLVPAAESMRRLERALGGDPSLLDGVEPDSLPASVEVTLAPGVRDVVAMSPTVRALRGSPGVDDVIVEDGGDERAVTALHALRIAGWSGAALLVGLAFLIVLAAIRVRMDRSQTEVAVAHLLGAGPGFLGIPTALAGALYGAVAALAALVAGAITLHVHGDAIVATLAPALGPIELALPPTPELALFVAASAALGFLGGALAGATRVAR